MAADASENNQDENYQEPSGDLTFGDTPFTLETTPAPSGNYLVGIIAEDLDGNTYEQYQPLFVENDQADDEAGLTAYSNGDIPFALLYPNTWEVDESAADHRYRPLCRRRPYGADDSATDELSRRRGCRRRHPTRLDHCLQDYADSYGLENMQVGDPVDDYLLGGYEGLSVEFSYELDGPNIRAKPPPPPPLTARPMW